MTPVPPVALLLILGALVWWLPPVAEPWPVCAAGLALVGGALCVAAWRPFRRARTTVDPRRPELASALITSGIYRYSRNPMYAGFAFMLLGWACWLGSAAGAPLVLGFVVLLDRRQIRPEERALEARFGADYQEYCGRVRRWL